MADSDASDDRRRYRSVALAMLAVLAVTLVAAAVAPVFSQDRGGDRSPQIEQPAANGSEAPPTSESSNPFRPVFVAVVVLCTLIVTAQFVTNPRETLTTVLTAVAFIGVSLVILRALMNRASSPESPEVNITSPPNATPTPTGSTGFGSGPGTTFSWPVESIAAIVTVVGVLVIAVAFALRSDAVRSTLGLDTPSQNTESDTDLDAVSRVAGEAADRVETASTPRSADNAIYRAWSEMVALLDAPGPQSGTPRQFEAAAVESGMDPSDVRLLTRTFEEVRYGGAPLSEDRRKRATAALRRIERAHGGEGDADIDGGDASSESRPRHDGERDDDRSEGNE